MEKEILEVSVEEFRKAVAERASEDPVTVDWADRKIKVRRRIGVIDMMAFVKGVVDSCFSADGEYRPETYDFALRSATLMMYAGFKLPEDAAEAYEFVYSDAGEEAYDAINFVIDSDQYMRIVDAIVDIMNYRKESNVQKVENIVADITRFIDEVQDKFGGLLEGVSGEDVSTLVNALANGFDEEKLMKAYLEAKKEDAPEEGAKRE